MRYLIPIGISLDIIDGWLDITDTLEPNCPFTLAREDGVGAFEFSSALYKGGHVPQADSKALHEMLYSFFRAKGLGTPIDIRTHSAQMSFAAASSRVDGLVRVWYISDAQSFVLATYTTDFEVLRELQDCEQMVESIVFES